jgi:hypothetical protein
MKRWTYALSFERPESAAPETFRGEVFAASAGRALALAYREAARKRTLRTWDDVAVVLEQGRVVPKGAAA